MTLLIPTRRANLLRNYENALFYDKKESRSERLYAFYVLVKPLLDWVKEHLVDLGLEPDEAESEIFLLAADIFKDFDTTKSSLVPYLSKAIVWKTERLLRSFSKEESHVAPGGLLRSHVIHQSDNEIYLKTPNILFEDKYLGKCFTKGQKYLISIILAADSKITKSELANQAGMERKNLRDRLQEIKAILKHGGYNARTDKRI